MILMFDIILGLLQAVPEGDYEALVAIMGYLMNVKERSLTTDDMFQPLTETIELLKFYDMDIPEEVNVLLQVFIKNHKLANNHKTFCYDINGLYI